MTKGWRKDSARHGLAAKGVSTRVNMGQSRIHIGQDWVKATYPTEEILEFRKLSLLQKNELCGIGIMLENKETPRGFMFADSKRTIDSLYDRGWIQEPLDLHGEIRPTVKSRMLFSQLGEDKLRKISKLIFEEWENIND